MSEDKENKIIEVSRCPKLKALCANADHVKPVWNTGEEPEQWTWGGCQRELEAVLSIFPDPDGLKHEGPYMLDEIIELLEGCKVVNKNGLVPNGDTDHEKSMRKYNAGISDSIDFFKDLKNKTLGLEPSTGRIFYTWPDFSTKDA